MLFVIRPLNSILKIVTFLLFFSTVWTNVSAKSSADFNQRGFQVPYYKSTQSLYPSGETAIENLTENQIEKISVESTYYFHKNQKISRSLLKTTTAFDLSRSENLRDLGLFMNLTKTALRLKPDLKSKSILTLPAENKFIALGFRNGFVLTKINHTLGYIDISDCISKFDFAKAIYAKHPQTKISKWFYVRNRNFDLIETVDSVNISLDQIEGLFPDNKKAIISTANQALPLWTALEIRSDLNNSVWNKSKIKGHGIVYWQNKSEVYGLNNEKIKIDELLKKDVSFVSFNPKNPKQAVASAGGLFITNDGENWKPVEQFKNYSGPVLFYNEFIIFAGQYKSIDGGKSFENYIQIEKLSLAISDTMGFDPNRLQVKKIRPVKPFKVEVEVDIGSRIIKLQTPVYSQDWRVVKI